jgi:hypothetical protein
VKISAGSLRNEKATEFLGYLVQANWWTSNMG